MLFLASGQQHWGNFDLHRAELSVHEDAQPGDGELLDLAAIETIRHGSTVYTVAPEQMPDAGPLAAILRY